jgi:hypothetical protein
MCDQDLDEDNWAASMKKRGQKICRPCFNTHHNKRLNPKNNPTRMYVNGKYIPKSHPLYKPGRYKTFSDAAFDGTYKLDSIKEGYVYVITNKAWPDWVKIGMAIDAEDRCNGYQTSSPHRDYVLEHSVHSHDRRKSEQQAHTRAAKKAVDCKGEWFKLPVSDAINILDNLDEYGPRATQEADTHTAQDKLQERPAQGDLWSYAEDRQAG